MNKSPTLILLTFLLMVSTAVGQQSTVVAWGQDDDGQVSGAPSYQDIVQVAAGAHHCVALRSDGSLFSWGRDTDSNGGFAGQVSNTPSTSDFRQVAAGRYFSVGLRSDGTVVAWGNDGAGQVSDAPATGSFIQVAAGEAHCVALKEDGALLSWGFDREKQVRDTPSGVGFVQVAAGKDHSVALSSDGTIVAWGMGLQGQTIPPPGNEFVRISSGSSSLHSLALRADGSLVSWGFDDFGQVSDTPSGFDFARMATGRFHSLAVRDDGTLAVWGGLDQFGEISDTPTGSGFSKVSSGYQFNVAILGPDPDADEDGLIDADEAALFGTDPLLIDSDGDGLGDGQESGISNLAAPAATSMRIFKEDQDPLSTTSPIQSDTDGGGMPDGQEDFNLDGAYQFGEFDPQSETDDRFDLTVSPLVRGTTVVLSVSDARPGSMGALLFSLVGPGPTMTHLGLSLDLSAPIEVHQSKILIAGSADFLVAIPLAAPIGLPVWIQAVERLFYADEHRSSEAWSGTVQ